MRINLPKCDECGVFITTNEGLSGHDVKAVYDEMPDECHITIHIREGQEVSQYSWCSVKCAGAYLEMRLTQMVSRERKSNEGN